MPLACPLHLLFLLKLENHLSQELEILYRAWAQKNKRIRIVFFFFVLFFGRNPPPLHPPPHTHPFRFGFFAKIQKSLTRDQKLCCRVRTLKSFTYFEMLIVPHALLYVDGCRFLFYLSLQSGLLFWFQCSLHLPLPHLQTHFFFFSDLDSLSKFTY